MQRAAAILSLILKACGALALLAFVALAWQGWQTMIEARATLAATREATATAPALITAEVDKQLTGARADLNGQLTQTRLMLDKRLEVLSGALTSQLSEASLRLLAQTGAVSDGLTTVLKSANTTVQSTNTATQTANEILASKDIPGLVRDSRITVARAARTMGHLEQMSDSIARETPKTAAAVSGIAQDVHKVTTELTKPTPIWRRAINAAYQAGRFWTLL